MKQWNAHVLLLRSNSLYRSGDIISGVIREGLDDFTPVGFPTYRISQWYLSENPFMDDIRVWREVAPLEALARQAE